MTKRLFSANGHSEIYSSSVIKKFINFMTAQVVSRRIENAQSLRKYVNGKTVAIIGNASSLIDKNLGNEIDEADIVIRINLGVVSKSSAQGSRCDILGISLPLSSDKVDDLFAPKFIIWLTPRWKHFSLRSSNHLEKTTFYPKSCWEKDFKKLKARPSSGYMLINFFTRILTPKTVKIYGFDFGKSQTLTDLPRKRPAQHDFAREQVLILEMEKEGLICVRQ